MKLILISLLRSIFFSLLGLLALFGAIWFVEFSYHVATWSAFSRFILILGILLAVLGVLAGKSPNKKTKS